MRGILRAAPLAPVLVCWEAAEMSRRTENAPEGPLATPGQRVLLLANPVAQLGRGRQAAQVAARLFEQRLPRSSSFSLAFSHDADHAVRIAASSSDVDVLIVLGGDGIINEAANGIMRLDRASRPTFGIIPVGSGNDFARTLGMSFNPRDAADQLFRSRPLQMDVGCCNGRFFVETLSFGLDAGIALDTVRRRKETGKTGLPLYAASSWDQVRHHRDVYHYEASFDGGANEGGDMILFAVQMGPTYGSGFRICPQARIDDGWLDACIAHPPIGLVQGVGLFMLAKGGRHTHISKLEMRRMKTLRLVFDKRPPVQIDGEPLVADSYDVNLVPDALHVLVPEASSARPRRAV
jgi:YegS/Rv2252/BmrU family lipid kinase